MAAVTTVSNSSAARHRVGGGQMPGEGGILRILELEGCLNMPACGSARQNQCFPIHGHPSIVAYSDADLPTLAAV